MVAEVDRLLADHTDSQIAAALNASGHLTIPRLVLLLAPSAEGSPEDPARGRGIV